MTDILLDNITGDLIIENNDVVVGESDLQHQELLLVIQKGELKESPIATVGIANYLRENDVDGMLHETRACFASDGMIVQKMAFDEQNNSLDYAADYKE